MTYTIEVAATGRDAGHGPFTDGHEAVVWAESHVAEFGWLHITPHEGEGVQP